MVNQESLKENMNSYLKLKERKDKIEHILNKNEEVKLNVSIFEEGDYSSTFINFYNTEPYVKHLIKEALNREKAVLELGMRNIRNNMRSLLNK